MKIMRKICWALLTLGMCVASTGVQAQAGGGKLVTLVVPFAAGGAVDSVARLFASNYETQSGQKMLVQNRPGAGAYIGSAFVAQAAPDGQTLLLSAFAAMHANLFVKDLPIDIGRSLMPIGTVAIGPQFLMGSSSLPVKNLAEFVAYARQNPGKLNAGVISNTTDHLNTLIFLRAAKIDVLTVPYNSGTDGLKALVGGELQLFLSTRNGILAPQIQAGKIIPLAVIGNERSELQSDVATTREQGVPMDTLTALYAVFGPLGLPQAMVTSMNKQIHAAVSGQTMRERLFTQGMLPPKIASSAEDLGARFAKELKDMKDAATQFGIKPQ